MPRFLTQRRALFLLIVLAIISAMLPPDAARAVSSWPRARLGDMVSFVAMPVHAVFSSLRRPEPLGVERGPAGQLQQNYDALLRYNAWLAEELRRTRAELGLYRVASRQMRLEGIRLEQADVTAWAGNRSRQTLTISAGSLKGIRPGLVVTDPSSFTLVGRVTQVGSTSATVELVTSPGNRLEVRFLPSTPVALAREAILSIQADRKGTEFTAIAKADTPVAEGYLAHLVDTKSVWPQEARGFVVGKVTAVEPLSSDPLMYRTVTVTPIAPPATLSRVLVLVPADQAHR